MSKIELPPLPACEVYRATWDSGWSQYHDESDPLPAVWDDTAPDEVQGFFSGDQLRARDRQIVELCASLCDQYEMAKWKAYRHGHGPERASDYTQGQSDGAGDCGNAIRSLLDPAEKETSHGA